jgi:signal transduction histidine kinase/ActR/RegA family two-component response regulator
VSDAATGIYERAPDDAAILAEQVRVVYVEGQRLIWAGLAASLVVVVVLWTQISHGLLLGWLGFFWIYAVLRTLLERHYRRSPPGAVAPRVWLRRIMAALAVGGCIWGAAGILLYVPGRIEYQLFLSVMLFGAVVSSLVTLAVYLPAYLLYATPIVAATTLRYGVEGDPLHIGIAIGAMILLFMFSNFGRFIQRSFVESLRLRMELAERNRELAERNEALEVANHMRTRFLAAASHDLRQPLHAMALFVDAIDETVRDPASRGAITRLRQCSQGLDDLLGGLLDVSKFDAGAVPLERRAFALQPLLDRLQTEFQALADAKGVALQVRRTREIVWSDAELLERILRNLLANAVRYTDQGRVLVGCRRRGPDLRLEVWDTGVGIPADQRREIFREFVKLRSTGETRGLGLGLSIVERSARLLERPVELRSTPGRGSVFSIQVPRAAEVDLDGRAGPVAVSARLADRSILVVDDDPDVRDAMAHALAAWGCRASLAASVEEALRRCKDHGAPPDAIVVDYQLPGDSNGVVVAQRLRGVLGASAPVVVITGDTSSDTAREVANAGYAVLHKPVKPARLRALLSHLLDTAGAAEAQ